MIPGVIAQRYATALLELGLETRELDSLVDEVQRAARAYAGSDDLRRVLADPLIPALAKQQIVLEIAAGLGLGQTAKNALALLVDRRRIQALPAIAERLRELADERRGVVRAEVLTAMPLPEEYFTQLQQQLERVTGRRIALDRKLDPSLISGVVARVGDTVYDGSLVSRLKKLQETMLPN